MRLIAAALTGFGLIVFAGTATAGETFHACVSKYKGFVRIVAVPDHCKKNEKHISWNSQGPAGAPGTTAKREWVGCTADGFKGEKGKPAANAECAAEFGPDARMCLSTEVLDSVPPGGTPICWVHPVYQPVASTSADGSNDPIIVDASGLSNAGFGPATPSTLSCRGWASPSQSERGLIVGNTGSFNWAACSGEIPVSCCAPPAPPE